MSCIPPPASVRPRKVYNILVPDVFPAKPPDLIGQIPQAVEKNLQKLGDYLQRNPERCGKVSRRLMRRLLLEIKMGDQLGFVKVAAEAYVSLLIRSSSPECTFSFKYFTTELINAPEPVIIALINHQMITVQALGVKIIGYYIMAQNEFDNQADIIESLISEILKLVRNSGDRSPELQKACLQAVEQYLAFCDKIHAVPKKLEDLQAMVLTLLLSSNSLDEEEAQGEEKRLISSYAQTVLLSLQPFIKEASSIQRVTDVLFDYADKHGGWEDIEIKQNIMQLLKGSFADQTFPIFVMLIRHSSAPGLSVPLRGIIVNLAAQEVPANFAMPALMLALEELAKALLAACDGDYDERAFKTESFAQFKSTVTYCCRKFAEAVGEASQVCEALSASLRAFPEESPLAHACVDCCQAAAGAINSFDELAKMFPGRMFPIALLTQMLSILTMWEGQTGFIKVMLQVVLPYTDNMIRDERMCQHVIAAVYTACSRRNSTPQTFIALDVLARAALRSLKPAVMLAAARVIIALQQNAVNWDRPEGSGSQRALCSLMLVNSLLIVMADMISCPRLEELLLPVDQACMSMRALELTPDGLSAISNQFDDFGDAIAEDALMVVAAKAPSGIWADTLMDFLAEEGILANIFGAELRPLLAAHFVPPVFKAGSLISNSVVTDAAVASLVDAQNADPTDMLPDPLSKASITNPASRAVLNTLNGANIDMAALLSAPLNYFPASFSADDVLQLTSGLKHNKLRPPADALALAAMFELHA